MTLVIAHRGASAYAPENTLPAFELAHQQGADMIELDVQRSADGKLVLFHDDTTERWDGLKRLVSDCSFDELLTLDIGGAKVMSFADACQFAADHQIKLNVELKQAGIGREVAQAIRDAKIEDLVLFSSFGPQALDEVAEYLPNVPRAYLMGTNTYRPDVRFREAWPFGALRKHNCNTWHPYYDLPLIRQILPRVRQAGIKVNIWTVNDPQVMQSFIDLGIDGIITDKPDVLRALLNK